ncbi:hypothetical protein [Erythrobacter sp. R86502]|uniref:hypothetical protein n=1 Tax=Erythrobacter sp. R86502 TaxID=3093846 RepID=UPI0036D286BD
MVMEFLKLSDANLAKEFNKKPEKDLMPARRAKVVESINKALASIADKQDNPKRGLYTTREGISCATLRLGNRKLKVDGAEEFYVPRERIQDFYKAAVKSVEAGELDAAINAALGGEATKGTPRMGSVVAKERSPIAPWRVYRRNIGRYGQARADEILDTKNSPEEAKAIREDYKANKDAK